MNLPKGQIREHVQIILDSIADGVFTVDMEMCITSFNRAAEQITGISKHDAIGRPCFDVLRANVCEENCLLRQTIETQKPVINFPVYILRADKKSIPIGVTTALLKDAGGRIMGGVETFRDLTAVDKLRKELHKKHSFEDIVSKNPRMLDLFAILPQVAESNSSVLIEGASGTGKELFARALHNSSYRRQGPFVAVNCGALPDTLCESELFGYKAGAFTDAKKDKPGRFALAQNGTIFLDEIGDISPAVQSRLLRVLEEKVYEPLGSTAANKTNARVITATNRNLEKLVKEGSFREDLYFRIDIVKLTLPPLCERKEDIPLLADHFIDRFNYLSGKKIVGISRKAMAALMLHDWPGNVRELENAIEHAFVLCQEGIIRLHQLPTRVVPTEEGTVNGAGLTLKDAEKQTILQALQRNGWRRMATARELGIDKNTLRRKIIRLGIVQPPS
ncbi:MAG: sigma 54-interacting transcriptional regulator [Desulfobacteraceae bacterium]|nr:sigma 54-interacting transcriptional regulator [Desulfobacteraceae bacterium]